MEIDDHCYDGRCAYGTPHNLAVFNNILDTRDNLTRTCHLARLIVLESRKRDVESLSEDRLMCGCYFVSEDEKVRILMRLQSLID